MECHETTTATGEGFWGRAYRVKLIRRERRYTGRDDQQQRELIDYGLRFQDLDGGQWDRRFFASEEERSAFIEHTITDLHLSTPRKPVVEKMESLFAGLMGDRVSSVTFVEDYVQIHFDRNSFNFYNWPLFHEGEACLTREQDTYCDKLAGLIGRTVRAADEYLDIGLVLEFESPHWLNVPLRAQKDWLGYDIAEYWGPNGQWGEWTAGEPPYE